MGHPESVGRKQESNLHRPRDLAGLAASSLSLFFPKLFRQIEGALNQKGTTPSQLHRELFAVGNLVS